MKNEDTNSYRVNTLGVDYLIFEKKEKFLLKKKDLINSF